MGRRRHSNKHWPPRFHRKVGAFYHVTSTRPRVWTKLGTDESSALEDYWRIERASSGGRTVQHLIDAYLTRCLKPLAASTQDDYRRMAKRLGKVFGHMALGAIKPPHVAEYMDLHPHPDTARNEVYLLQGMYRKAIRWGWTEFNPCKGVERPPVRKRLRYITDEEFRRIYAAVKLPSYRLFMELAYMTGVRVGDLCRLSLSAIRDEGLRVWQSKGKREIVFTWTPELRETVDRCVQLPRRVVRLRPGDAPDQPLIPTIRGRHYSRGTVSDRIIGAAKTLGILDVHFHDLRAKTASDDPDQAQKRLDHKDGRTTRQHYIRLPTVVAPLARKL